MSFFKKLFGNKVEASTKKAETLTSDAKPDTCDVKPEHVKVFEAITSLEAAKLSVEKGVLVPIYIMPLEF